MAGSAGEDFAQAFVQAGRLVFSLLFPLILISSCAAAFVLIALGYPQFAVLGGLAAVVVEYAEAHHWAALLLFVLVAGAIPLARVAYREYETRSSHVIGYWVGAIGLAAFTAWLATAWPPTASGFQGIVFAFLLFGVCGGVCDAVISTLKLREMSRPRRGPEVVEAQKAHGDARLADEAEAVAFLNSKK
jgi:hypothetical protein